ncbi:MAG: rhomboid family intramembrane serine protease [Acidobacteriota bacterium]
METRRMCPQCRAFIKKSDRVCPYCETEVGPRAVDWRRRQEVIAGIIPHARFTTTIILLVNFGLYAALMLSSMRAGEGALVTDIDLHTLFAFGAKHREAILLGQWWRLITAGFLHGGLLHILMNSWCLFDLGAVVEETYGAARMVVIYFVATVLGFAASAWWLTGLSVGASAGLFGLIGAMIALRSAPRGLYVRWAIYGLILGLLPGLHVDNAAHLGGLAAGFGVGYLAGTPGVRKSTGERLWRAAAYVCIALTALSFVNMYLWLTTGPR